VPDDSPAAAMSDRDLDAPGDPRPDEPASTAADRGPDDPKDTGGGTDQSDADTAEAGDGEAPPAEEFFGAGDDEGGADWIFDDADLAPVTDDLGDGLTAEDLERLEQERQAAVERDREARKQVERELDDQGRQRRQNVRVMVQYPVTIRIAGHPNIKARTRDLSATGVGFATRLPLDVDAAGSVTVHFPDWSFEKEFVVRFVKPILAGRQIGAQFRELTEDEREKVVKEVFAVQRAQLQEQRARNKAGD
jgi:hypothetical protein